MRDLELRPWAMAGSAGALVALGAWLPAAPLVLAGLTVLVVVHEAAHLLAARRVGIAATEFFAGFGPVVVAWRTRTGLRVGLKAIPAGGYVKVVGMTRKERVEGVDEARTYRAASPARRLAVVCAGPAANLLLGLLLVVGARAIDPMAGQGPGLAGAVRQGWSDTLTLATQTVEGVVAVATDLDGYLGAVRDPEGRADEAPGRFLSPVGVAQIADDVADRGPATVLLLVGIVSLGLGVLNLLPLPPLDGGHAAIVLVERAAALVLRRPDLRLDAASPAVAAVTAATLVFVLGLGATSIVLDVRSPVSL